MQQPSTDIATKLTNYISDDITPSLLHILLLFLSCPVWSVKINEDESNLDEYFALINGWKWAIDNIFSFWFALQYFYFIFIVKK